MQQPKTSRPDISLQSEASHPLYGAHTPEALDRVLLAWERLFRKAPRVHCLTNAVTINDVANILLAIGGSAIMAQCGAEVAQITANCHATLLNTGTPSDEKFAACRLAGIRANELGHPVVLDPVGVGASTYRQEKVRELLSQVHPDLIRCNMDEALTLLALSGQTEDTSTSCPLPAKNALTYKAPYGGADAAIDADAAAYKVPHGNADATIDTDAAAYKAPHGNADAAIDTDADAYKAPHGGVDAAVHADATAFADTAAQLARTYRTTVLISGSTDAVSDGGRTTLVTGGDARIVRISGSGCMLSAICAALLAAEENGYDATVDAALLWRRAAERAGRETDASASGLGSFHMFLLDAATNISLKRGAP